MNPYYNATTDGLGLGGILNYTNNALDGWMSTAFLGMIWIILVFVGAKSEWKLSSVITFAFFLTFLLSMIMSLFLTVSSYVMFILGIGIALSLFWSSNESK